MFRSLRNHFILIAMSLLTVVLVASFSAIYVVTAARLSGPHDRRPLPVFLQDGFGVQEFNTYVDQQRQDDDARTLRSLAVTLILTGAATLTAGYFVSRYLADRAIEPVRQSYDRQKQFVVDASHELKTPLSVIDANIEAEMAGKKNPSKWLRNIQDETARMSGLVTDMLTLAKLDIVDESAKFVQFDASEIINQTIESIELLLEDKSLRLNVKLEKPLQVTSDAGKLRQIMTILLDNAVKYTKPGGKIEVVARSTGSGIEIAVKNSHKPLSEEDLSKLFDRFYQADESHSDKGYGLGLSIAKAAAEKIGAWLSVEQEKNTIVFRLLLNK